VINTETDSEFIVQRDWILWFRTDLSDAFLWLSSNEQSFETLKLKEAICVTVSTDYNHSSTYGSSHCAFNGILKGFLQEVFRTASSPVSLSFSRFNRRAASRSVSFLVSLFYPRNGSLSLSAVHLPAPKYSEKKLKFRSRRETEENTGGSYRRYI
jgi:hypothetical protein